MSAVHALVTGRPGSGKTTAIKRTCDILRQQGFAVCGFYTEEVRNNGSRIGFDVVPLSGCGGRSILAREDPGGCGKRTNAHVGRYLVNVPLFEEACIAALRCHSNSQENSKIFITVIDEIGKMELKSTLFVQEVHQIFATPKNVILATIPNSNKESDTLITVKELLKRPDIRLFEVTKANRDTLPNELAMFLKTALSL